MNLTLFRFYSLLGAELRGAGALALGPVARFAPHSRTVPKRDR